MIVYKITNLINGKIYIGQDSYNNPEYFGSGLLMKRALKKYGKDNFIKEILEYCEDKNELNNKEIFWIKKLNSINNDIGYNISNGGNGGNLGEEVNRKISEKAKQRKLSEETKKKLSEINKGVNNSFYGKHHTVETIKFLSENKKGFKHTKQTKIKISRATKGKNNPFYSKNHTQELKNRFRKNYGFKVIVYDKYKNIITIYDSIRDASEKEKITRFFIRKSSNNDSFIVDKKYKIIYE